MYPELSHNTTNIEPTSEQQVKLPDIPFENRIAELGPDDGYINEWMSIGEIVLKMDTGKNHDSDKRHVRRQIIDLGIPHIVDEAKSPNHYLYPPKTLELLLCERKWSEDYSRLPNLLVLDDIADFIGRSRGWSEKTLSDSDSTPIYQRWGSRLVAYYNKKAIKFLRNINLQTPLDNGWYNLGVLAEVTGEDREWIQRRLDESNLKPEERRSSLTGKVSDHFPPEALDIVERAKQLRAVAGGAWLTEATIASIMPTSGTWVRSRLSDRYSHLAEPRQDDHRVTRNHYPPWILDELLEEALKHEKYPPMERHLPISVVARKVGHHVLWVENRLQFIGAEPKLRRDGQNRVIECYSPRVPKQLLGLPSDILKRFKDLEVWFG